MMIFRNMEQDTLIPVSNVITPIAVGMAVMNPLTILTVISVLTSIVLNVILIYKKLKEK
jgi:hypothetical protein